MADVYVVGENGLLAGVWPESAIPDGIAHRLGTGDLTRVNPDGSPWTGPDEEDGTEPADAVPADAPALPDRKAARPVWVEFAISQGMARDDAAAMTKAQLITEFTQERDAP